MWLERLWISGAPGIPLRSTNEPFRGMNKLLLSVAAVERGFEHRHWMTYKTAKGMGAQVRGGEKGELVVYADEMTKQVENRETGEMEDRPMLGFSQGIYRLQRRPDRWPSCGLLREAGHEAHGQAGEDRIQPGALSRTHGAKIIEGGNHAFYRPRRRHDPNAGNREVQQRRSYHAIELHELVHWSGAKHRLNRKIGKDFRSPDYAREELVAEIGAAFLCASIEITPEVRPDHAGYLESWLKVLKADKRAIFAAAAQAQKAADFLHGLQPK